MHKYLPYDWVGITNQLEKDGFFHKKCRVVIDSYVKKSY